MAMSVYIEFSKSFMWAVSDWLMAEPVCYVWGGCLLCFILKAISGIVRG